MNRPTLRQFEFAVALARHCHFGKAAKAVHVSQPGLSSQIKELEDRLGVTLFERDRRKVRLTAAGEEVVKRAQDLLLQVDELSLAASLYARRVQGRVRLVAIPTMGPYLLPALTQAMTEKWPFVNLVLHEEQTSVLLEDIRQGNMDLGLIALPFETGDLHVEQIGEEPFLLATSEGHRLSGSSPVPVSVLENAPLLLLEEGHCLRDHALAACQGLGGLARREIHTASLSTLAQMVASGAGVTLLPASAVHVEARPGSGLLTRPLEPSSIGRSVALVWRRSDPRHEHFLALAEELGHRDLVKKAGERVGAGPRPPRNS